MNMFAKKDKDNLLEAMTALDKAFPLMEYDDRDFCATLLYRMRKMVETYGPKHGVMNRVTPQAATFIPEKIRGIKESDVKQVIVNGPATIILWKDGTKTVVQCQEEDLDRMTPEAGIAIAVMKKVFGNKGNFNNVLRRLVKKAVKN